MCIFDNPIGSEGKAALAAFKNVSQRPRRRHQQHGQKCVHDENRMMPWASHYAKAERKRRAEGSKGDHFYGYRQPAGRHHHFQKNYCDAVAGRPEPVPVGLGVNRQRTVDRQWKGWDSTRGLNEQLYHACKSRCAGMYEDDRYEHVRFLLE